MNIEEEKIDKVITQNKYIIELLENIIQYNEDGCRE